MAEAFAFLRFAALFAVTAATALVAVLVLLSDRRRDWNRFLAAFLLLVAGNFGLQAASAFLHVLEPGALATTSWVVQFDAQAARVATVLLVVDPPALVYFASLFPRRTGPATSTVGALALFAPAVAFLGAEVFAASVSHGLSSPMRLGFFAYLGGCYAYASWRLFVNFLAEPSTVMAAQLRLVTFGFLVAAVPRVALVVTDTQPFWERWVSWNGTLVDLVVRDAILWLSLALVVWTLRRHARGPDRRASARGLLVPLVLVYAFFTTVWTLERALTYQLHAGGTVAPWLRELADLLAGGVVYAVRWLLFSGAVLYGIVRYQVLSTDRRVLHAGAGTAVVLGGFVLVTAASTALGAWGGAAFAALAAGGGILAYGVAGERRVTGRRGAYLHERALDVYRARLATALARASTDGVDVGGLTALRERLGVSAREHELLLAIAEAEEHARPDAQPVLGRYEVLRRLGAGGYATVHLARDRGTDELVVLKQVQEAWVGGARAVDAALRETEVARRVSHPNVVAIHDMARVPGGAVIVMEYAAGGSLRELLAREGPLSPETVSRHLREVLHALDAVHGAGIVHGDLKPENLLLAEDGRLLLADFGVAQAHGAARTLVSGSPGGARGGTLAYMAPEQWRGEAGSPQSDLYALAAIAYEALAGRTYLDASGPTPHGPNTRGPGAMSPIPVAWAAFLSPALEPDPARRYRSAAEMLDRVPPASTGTSRLRR